MSDAGTPIYCLSNTLKIHLLHAFRSVLRHVSMSKAWFFIPNHKNVKNELFLSFVLPIKRRYKVQKHTYFEFSEALKKAFALDTIKRRQTTTNYDFLRTIYFRSFPKF